MSNKQGKLKDFDGNYVSPVTTAALVYDAAKDQALSQTLYDTPDRNALGFPAFSTVTAYAEGDIVFYNNKLWKFTADHDAGAWNAAQVEAYSVKDLVDDSVPEDAQLAENLKSWAERDALNVGDDWTDHVRTTAGDQSIDSAKGARLLSIVAQKDFSASAYKATGFNLLHGATGIGDGFYFPVPALTFGVYGTAAQPNGVLFTSNANQRLTPTVRFKAMSAGVPSSVNDGSACAYTDSNGYRFYTCDEPGYMIVSGITFAQTCAHIAWSRRYDEFVSPTSVEDAGTVIDLTPLGTMRTVGSGASLVADRADRTDDTHMLLTTKVGRVQPTWTRGTQDAETGLYPYTATVSGIKSSGLAEFEGANKPAILVDGTTLTYYSADGTALTDYVKYELATPTTSSKSVSTKITALEDWGLEILAGATGTAIVTTQYAQSYPDALAALLANIDQATIPIICEAFAYLKAEIDGLKASLHDAANLLKLSVGSVDTGELYRYGVPAVLYCDTAGAPAAARIPANWDEKKMGTWTGVPRFLGQVYLDRASKKVYMSSVMNYNTNDWVVLN